MRRIVSCSTAFLKNGIDSFIIRQVYVASKGQSYRSGQPKWYSTWEWAGEGAGSYKLSELTEGD